MARKKSDWRDEEGELLAHVHGLCFDGKGGMGCADCSPGYDHYPEGGHAWPENLDGVERVSFIPAKGN